jgi:hypothetical protein
MATISFSTAYVSAVTNDLTITNFNGTVAVQAFGTPAGPSATNFALQTNFLEGSLFSAAFSSSGGSSASTQATPGTITFKDSTNATLVTYTTAELTRTMDAAGYVVMSNFPPKTPSAAGTISTIIIDSADATTSKQITLSVGAPGGGADIQFDDRALVTTQPWRLDGNIKFRVPVSYEYTV